MGLPSILGAGTVPIAFLWAFWRRYHGLPSKLVRAWVDIRREIAVSRRFRQPALAFEEAAGGVDGQGGLLWKTKKPASKPMAATEKAVWVASPGYAFDFRET